MSGDTFLSTVANAGLARKPHVSWHCAATPAQSI